MKQKFGLSNIFLQMLIFMQSGFIILTQFNTLRQPVKILIQAICLFSLLSLLINIYNYIREDKE